MRFGALAFALSALSAVVLPACAVAAPCEVVYNTDGCDMLYYTRGKPVTAEGFVSERLSAYIPGSAFTRLAYCPQSSGFGHFTALKAGELLDEPVPPRLPPKRDAYNATADFAAVGLDALGMAVGYARASRLPVFLAIRVNDTHDSEGTPERPLHLYPQFKKDHPEFLMGRPEKGRRPPFCTWSAVDFTHAEVRERMKGFVREFMDNYDVDGVDYDFFRHLELFRSVAWGGEASDGERALLTELMRDLRRITGSRKVSVRTPDSAGYCRAIGIDIGRWLAEGLVDEWIGAGYFQLEQWNVGAELAHRHGARYLASIDESRIPGYCREFGLKCIPGRNSLAFFAARFAAARELGCDGVEFFNVEYFPADVRKEVVKLHPDRVAGLDKTYFAVERGSGGYRPQAYLRNGDRFDRMPKLDPGVPHAVGPAEPYAFRIAMGDERGAKSAVAELLTNIADDRDVRLSVNGREYGPAIVRDGLFTFRLDPSVLRRGLNDFAVTVPGPASAGRGRPITLNDFAVSVSHSGRPVAASARDFPITAFGARPGGASCTDAFAAAIGVCAASGGGRVVVPPGDWTTGAIHLKSDVELHLAEGARVVFTDDPADYLPAVLSSWGGIECLNYSPLVYAFGCTNVAVTGTGRLSPRMDTWQGWMGRPKAHLEALGRLYAWGDCDEPVGNRDMTKIPGANLRPQLMQFNRCRDVRLEGFRVDESPLWTIHLLVSTNVVARGLDVHASGFNTDGIDIESSRDVLVEGCTFCQGDDAVVIKSGRDRDGRRRNVPTENVTVRNCRISSYTMVGFVIGSEVSGGVRNVLIEDCTAEYVKQLFSFKTSPRKGGFIEDVRIRRIRANSAGLFLRLNQFLDFQWGLFPSKWPECPTRIRNVSISDVDCAMVGVRQEIDRDARCLPENLTLSDIRLGTVADEGHDRIGTAK